MIIDSGPPRRVGGVRYQLSSIQRTFDKLQPFGFGSSQ
jgi:hypothetical protein